MSVTCVISTAALQLTCTRIDAVTGSNPPVVMAFGQLAEAALANTEVFACEALVVWEGKCHITTHSKVQLGWLRHIWLSKPKDVCTTD